MLLDRIFESICRPLKVSQPIDYISQQPIPQEKALNLLVLLYMPLENNVYRHSNCIRCQGGRVQL